MSWSAQQYVRFEAERTRAARDLLAGVSNASVGRIVDLGCGPGNSTELLVRRYPQASVLGVDSSPEMIEAARTRLPHASFMLVAIDQWHASEPHDLIFANASLHWVPDHSVVLPRLVNGLSLGGTLAIQMPDNLQEPSHVLMREIAAQGRWAPKLKAAVAARTSIQSAGWYYDLLRTSCTRVDVWRTTYHHAVDGVNAIVQWFKGSGLRPYLDALEPAERKDYLEQYGEALTRAYPAQRDGKVLLRFPRLFIVTTR